MAGLSAQRRIKVDGFDDSDVYFKVAIVVLKTGELKMIVEGLEQSLQHLADIRQMFASMARDIDRKLPEFMRETVHELVTQ